MNKQYFAAFILLMIGMASFSFINADKRPIQRQGLKRIVIDAGHGGADIGAKGKYSTEAAIALSIALKLEKMIADEMPDIEVVMTRRTDVFDPVTRKA